MTREPGLRIPRRSLVQLAGAFAGAGFGARAVRARAQTPPTLIGEGDCTVEPGVQLLVDFNLGRPVSLTLTDLQAPTNWQPYRHPTLPLLLFIPPDWTGVAGWADSYSASGRPNWTDQRPDVPQLNLARVISAEGDAAFEYVVGNILGQPMTPEQVAPVAKQSLLGEDPDIRSICTFLDTNPLNPAFFQADRFEQSIHITAGNAVGLPSLFAPATTVSFQNFFGPRTDFEELMRDVFLRFVVQFMGGGGDGGDDGGDDGDDGGDGDDDGDDGDGDG